MSELSDDAGYRILEVVVASAVAIPFVMKSDMRPSAGLVDCACFNSR